MYRTWSVVTAAALLAEAPEQRGDVFSQDAAAVLYEEANQLTHLQGGTTPGYYTEAWTLWLLSAAADRSFSSVTVYAELH